MKEQLHHIGISYEQWQIAFHGDRGTIRVVTFRDLQQFVNSANYCRKIVHPQHVYYFNQPI